MKKQAFLFVAGGETYQMIRGTPLRLAQTYILVNARGWSPWCPSIQSSVPLGVGGSFPKIASQRALVARGGLCEFGARSNWPPRMPALILFTKCCNCVNNLVLLPLEKWWDHISFSQSKIPPNSFSLLLPPWNWTRLEMRGGADSNRGPRGGASVKEDCKNFWYLCFEIFVIPTFVDDCVLHFCFHHSCACIFFVGLPLS